MSLILVIGNKTYSSWSLRPWLAMKVFGVKFTEKLIPLYQDGSKQAIFAENAAGKVPVLKDGGLLVWDSLAILEYLEENQALGKIWPKERAARATARCIAAEMHAGFNALRSECPMNARRRIVPYTLSTAAEADVARIVTIWEETRKSFGHAGPFLFGAFSGADAMYAPVVLRLHFYAIPVSAAARAYMDTVLALPAMQEWLMQATEEPWVIEANERY